MAPTAHAQTIVISPGTKFVTHVGYPANTGTKICSTVNKASMLPKYAVGLFDANVGNGPRKRKRLTHLTPEEKIMRRKLKNRVAAQTARDRKKVKMESLEETVYKVQQQVEKLLEVNIKLMKRTEVLEQENNDFKVRLGITPDTDATVSGNKETLRRIKMEFDAMSSSLEDSEPLPDSILSPDESSDENENHYDLKRRAHHYDLDLASKRPCLVTDECVSPLPAVLREHVQKRHSPQQQEAVNSPLIHLKVTMAKASEQSLVNRALKMISLDYSNKSVMSQEIQSAVPKQAEAMVSIGPEHMPKSTGDVVTSEQLESIKELINIDHLYSKSNKTVSDKEPSAVVKIDNKSLFKVQLSRSTRLTKLIKQDAPTLQIDSYHQKKKPSALFEEVKRLKSNSTDVFTEEEPVKQKVQPMLCNIKEEVCDTTRPVSVEGLDFDNLDAELDNILSGNLGSWTNPPLVLDTGIDADLSATLSSNSYSSGSVSPDRLSDCSSTTATIDTPSPLSDITDPFHADEGQYDDLFGDMISTDLFPQLAL